MVTLLSIACGFASIVISVDNATVGDADAYRLAAALLVLAGVFDALDGYVGAAGAALVWHLVGRLLRSQAAAPI
ncbi:MAG: hypothetical protein RSH52_10035, partial [Janthinobacterium sp.]